MNVNSQLRASLQRLYSIRPYISRMRTCRARMMSVKPGPMNFTNRPSRAANERENVVRVTCWVPKWPALSYLFGLNSIAWVSGHSYMYTPPSIPGPSAVSSGVFPSELHKAPAGSFKLAPASAPLQPVGFVSLRDWASCSSQGRPAQ